VLIAGSLAAEQKTAETSNTVAPSGATTAPAPSPEIPLGSAAVDYWPYEIESRPTRGFSVLLSYRDYVETIGRFN